LVALTQPEAREAVSAEGALRSAQTGVAAIVARFAGWRADGSDRSVAQRVAGAAFFIRVASAGILYVSQVLLARWMGRFEFGIYVYVWTWVGLVGMAAPLGIGYSAQRFIPEYRTRGDLDGLRGFLAASRLIGLGLGIAAGALMAGIVLVLRDFMPSYYVTPFLLASLTLPIFTVCVVQDSAARAFSWVELALVPAFITHPLMVLAVMGGLALATGAITAAATLAVAAATLAVVAVIQGVLLNRRLSRSIAPGGHRYEPLFWFKTALPLFVVDGFFLMLTYVDTLILQLFVGPAEVAVYYAATKTLALVHFIYFSVGIACVPRFSEYHVTGQRERLARFVADATRWTFWPSLAVGVALLTVGRPILALFGPGFAEGYPLIFIMTVGLIARASVGPAERLLNMVGQQNVCAAIYCGAFAVNLTLCVILIPYFGLFGAAIATATGVVTETVLLLTVIRRRLGLHVFVWGGTAAT
jgi:O-antigen/teichoic acid export membrane protein